MRSCPQTTITKYLVTLSLLASSSWALPSKELIPTPSQPSLRPLSHQATSSEPSIQSQAPAPIAAVIDQQNKQTIKLLKPTAEIYPDSSATSTSSVQPIISFLGNRPPTQNWIESILVQVESQLQGQQVPSSEEHDDVQETVASMSLAPTDSAEDPLERWPVAEGSTVEQLDASDKITVTENSVIIRHEPSTNADSDITEERLVDSNNLSAIIANDHRPESPVLTTTKEVGGQLKTSCEQAFAQCAWRKACARALSAYNEHCQDLIGNKTVQCSAKCLKAMIALRSSDEGDQLASCDCEGNEYCLQTKRQSQACAPQVEEALNPGVVVSCSTATWICLADQLCSTALDYYHRFCQSLFSQRHCSQRCNNSLSILNRQPKASKLITCHCDGTEDFPCVKYKTYTERLCLNKPASVMTHQFFLEDQSLFSTGNRFNQHRTRRRDSSRFMAFTSAASIDAPSLAVFMSTGILLFMLQALNLR